MKIYISGPITGTEGYMENFERAEKKLKQFGHEVVNPARVCESLPRGTTHEQYMSLCLPMVDMCDMVILLPGWRDSKGCKMEVNRALQKEVTISFATEEKK